MQNIDGGGKYSTASNDRETIFEDVDPHFLFKTAHIYYIQTYGHIIHHMLHIVYYTYNIKNLKYDMCYIQNIQRMIYVTETCIGMGEMLTTPLEGGSQLPASGARWLLSAFVKKTITPQVGWDSFKQW